MPYRSYVEIGPGGWPMMRMPEKLAVPEEPPPIVAYEQSRRRDAVREAAREFEPLSDQDVRERLRGLTNRPLTEAEVSQFTADVATQVLDDLVDVLDQQLRGRARRRRTVRLNAPRGYVRKAFHDRSDPELVELADRLRARGWTTAQVQDHYARHLKVDRVLRVAPSESDKP